MMEPRVNVADPISPPPPHPPTHTHTHTHTHAHVTLGKGAIFVSYFTTIKACAKSLLRGGGVMLSRTYIQHVPTFVSFFGGGGGGLIHYLTLPILMLLSSKHKGANILEKHLNPLMLVFIGYRTLR